MDAPTVIQAEKLALDMQRRVGGRVRNLWLLVQDGGLALLGQAGTYRAKQAV